MKQQQIYNLAEFASKYHLKDIFGAYAAYFSIGGEKEDGIATQPKLPNNEDFYFCDMVKERTLFTKLLLIKRGHARIVVSNQLSTATKLPSSESEAKDLSADDFLIVTAKEVLLPQDFSPEFEAECILVDEQIVPECTLFHLSEDKRKSVLNIFHFVRDIVRHQHINKVEMIKSMFNVLKLIIEELPYEQCSVTRDLSHKKEIYEIFLHHLYRNFQKERQIRFYADRLNVSAAYLSRLVREISGSTVNDHVTSLVYKEICNLLRQTSLSIGEIADRLNFSDQSALTNFFKQRSGMTPLAYRNQ